MEFGMGAVLWRLVCQSDWMTWTVLGVLLLISISCWAVFIYQWFDAVEHDRLFKAATQQLRDIQDKADLYRLCGSTEGTLVEPLLRWGTRAVEKGCWSAEDRKQWRDSISDEANLLLMKEEGMVSFLRMAADGAPLLGLLGTIWGLIHSFMGITLERTADIVTVAPGIAEALITTLAGLFVAIPALFFFHIVMSRIRTVEHSVWMLVDQLEHAVGRLDNRVR